MKKLALVTIAFLHLLVLHAQQRKQTLSVLAIGTGHYLQSKFTIPDVNFSASAFLNCFKKYSNPFAIIKKKNPYKSNNP